MEGKALEVRSHQEPKGFVATTEAVAGGEKRRESLQQLLEKE